MAAKKAASSTAALISAAKAKAAHPPLPPEVKKGLQELIDYNDSAPTRRRVSAETAMKWLEQHGIVMGRGSFDALVRREFRRAWGTK